MSNDTRLVFDRMKEAAVGDTITYSELSGIIGRDVQGPGYSIVGSARRRLKRELNMIFDAVTNVGYKRLSDSEIVATSPRYMDSIRRKARAGAQTLTSVTNYDNLTAAQKSQHQAGVSVFGAIAAVTNAKAFERVEKAVAQSQSVLPLAKTLEVFAK